MAFLPANRVAPVRSTGGNYFKLQDGSNKIRVTSDAIVGYVYWSNQNKPVRSEEHPGNPADIRIGDDGKAERIRYFWAVTVWDYSTQNLSIWEITQATIQDQLEALAGNEDWGHPKEYDLVIQKSGKGLDTKYKVMPSPHKPMSAEIQSAIESSAIDLNSLFDKGGISTPTAGKPAQTAGGRDWETFHALLGRANSTEKILRAREWALNLPSLLEQHSGSEALATAIDTAILSVTGFTVDDLENADEIALPF